MSTAKSFAKIMSDITARCGAHEDVDDAFGFRREAEGDFRVDGNETPLGVAIRSRRECASRVNSPIERDERWEDAVLG